MQIWLDTVVVMKQKCKLRVPNLKDTRCIYLLSSVLTALMFLQTNTLPEIYYSTYISIKQFAIK